jgi:hypothetical protein
VRDGRNLPSRYQYQFNQAELRRIDEYDVKMSQKWMFNYQYGIVVACRVKI